MLTLSCWPFAQTPQDPTGPKGNSESRAHSPVTYKTSYLFGKYPYSHCRSPCTLHVLLASSRPRLSLQSSLTSSSYRDGVFITPSFPLIPPCSSVGCLDSTGNYPHVATFYPTSFCISFRAGLLLFAYLIISVPAPTYPGSIKGRSLTTSVEVFTFNKCWKWMNWFKWRD